MSLKESYYKEIRKGDLNIMNLIHLKELVCPSCGEQHIIEEKILTDRMVLGKIMVHANGERWELRKFSCGQLIEYVPNFSKTILSESYVCMKSNEYLERNKKRDLAKIELLDFISKLNIDEMYMCRLKERIENC